jgi:signal transduction histidine kinase
MTSSDRDELAQRVKELETIAQVSTAVSSILDLDTLLQQVLTRTKQRFNLYHVNIALLDNSGKNLIPILTEDDMLRLPSDIDVPPIPLNTKPSIVARVARERTTLLVNNVHEDPDFMPHPLLPEAQSELTLPLIVGDELIGILDVQSNEINRFTEADVRIHTTLAAQFAIAIQNARAYQLSQKHSHELSILNEMSRSLNPTQGIAALLTTFYSYVSRLIDTSNLYVAFYEPEQQAAGEIFVPLEVINGRFHWLNTRHQFGLGLTEYIVQTQKPLLIKSDLAQMLKELDLSVPGIRAKSWLGVPMMTGGNLTGVISVQSLTTPHAFNEDSLRLLVSMSNQISLAIENARLFTKVQDQARNLEIEVAYRTAKLTQANRQLITEVAERMHAEKTLKEYAAELERSNQELENFARVASHDLQEPLRKITAFGDRLQQKHAAQLDERGVDYLQRMQSAANRMQQLITDLLALSRVTTTREPFAVVALNEIAKEVLLDLEVRIEQTKATVEVGDLPEVEADPMQIRQLLQNLIGNALKFSRTNVSPVIKVTSQPIEKSGLQMCQLAVTDNGIGIEEQYLDRIFEVFNRLHTRSEVEGSGVGLAICRRIVERHRGTISVSSVPDEGTTFTVLLPCQQNA